MQNRESIADPRTSATGREYRGGDHRNRDPRDAFNAAKDRIRDSGAGTMLSGKTRAAETLIDVEDALRDTERTLRENRHDTLGDFTGAIADQLDNIADYVRNRGFQAMLDDGRDLARRHPVATAGVLFVTGLAVARMLKASSGDTLDSHDGASSGGYSSGGYSSSSYSSGGYSSGSASPGEYPPDGSSSREGWTPGQEVQR